MSTTVSVRNNNVQRSAFNGASYIRSVIL